MVEARVGRIHEGCVQQGRCSLLSRDMVEASVGRLCSAGKMFFVIKGYGRGKCRRNA